jgi:hypothetical protein
LLSPREYTTQDDRTQDRRILWTISAVSRDRSAAGRVENTALRRNCPERGSEANSSMLTCAFQKAIFERWSENMNCTGTTDNFWGYAIPRDEPAIMDCRGAELTGVKAKLHKQSKKRHRHAVDPDRRKRSHPVRQDYQDPPVPGGNQGGRQAYWSTAENDRIHSCDRPTLTGFMLRAMDWREPRISDRIERDE